MFLLLLAGAVGGTYVWSLWSRMDEMLQARLIDGFQEAVPNWNVSFHRARFDFQGLIRVDDFRLNSPDSEACILGIRETVLSVDREQLGHQRLVCQHIRLMQPELNLHRDLEGHWNWEALLPITSPISNPPEWNIERGTLNLTIERPAPLEPLRTSLQNAHLKLIPSGKRRYVISGQVLAGALGQIDINGFWNMDDRTWKVDGQIPEFQFHSKVWDQVCDVLPNLRNLLETLPERLNLPLTGDPVSDPGLTTAGDLAFHVQQQSPDAPIDYRCEINLKSGQWQHPLSPYTLDDIRAKIVCDPAQLVMPFFTARHGNIQVLVRSGKWLLGQPDASLTALVGFRNLPLEPATRARLTKNVRDIYDQIRPTGKVDINLRLGYSLGKGFQCDCDVLPKRCTAAHVKFPYPVSDIEGIIKKRGPRVDLDLKGIVAGQREVTLTGQVRPGVEHLSTLIEIRGDSVPLDEVFVASVPEAAQKALRSMNLQGFANFHYRLAHDRGPKVPWDMQLWSSVRDASMSCQCFPYAIQNLQGIVQYDGDKWTFEKLKGNHGATTLTGAGTYQSQDGNGNLDLTVKSLGVELNRDLQGALPENWRKLFDEFSPKGKFDCLTSINWTTGTTPLISLDADLKNIEIQLKSFPYPLSEVKGQVSVHPDEQEPTIIRADISDLTARHDDTRISLPNCFALVEPTGVWRVRLSEMQVEDLNTNNRFRRALPTGVREVIETLDPRDGPVSLGGMLEFRGTGKVEDGTTSAWDLEILCTNTSITAGVDLKHLYGKFRIRGTWNGRSIDTEGEGDLTSMSILGYQFANVKGPLSIYGNQLVIGCRDVVNPLKDQRGPQRKPAPEQRITGRAIGGVFTLDGIAVLGKETSYKVVLTMRDALLERYAELYMPNQRDLRGIMTGEAQLLGRGNNARSLKGNGQLLIRPAALYQLPVMLAIFKQLNGGSADNTAFEEGQAYFNISNGRFNFTQIDLKGAALNLKGFGWVSLDRRLSFDFFSSVSRNRAPLAILQQMVGQATVGWMGITVRGTLDNPDARIRPVQRLDDAVKRFLNGIDPRPPLTTGQRGPPIQ